MTDSENKRKAKKAAPVHAWKPGQSGNPGGRPKKNEELVLAAQAHTVAALETLAAIASGDDYPPAARVSAAVAILDRGYGKPSQAVAVSGADGGALAFGKIVVEVVKS